MHKLHRGRRLRCRCTAGTRDGVPRVCTERVQQVRTVYHGSVRQGVRTGCTTGLYGGVGTQVGPQGEAPPLARVAEGPVAGISCSDALARAATGQTQPTGDREMNILKDSSWCHLPGYGWRTLARTGSRKRITSSDASVRPLRHGSQRDEVRLTSSLPSSTGTVG